MKAGSSQPIERLGAFMPFSSSPATVEKPPPLPSYSGYSLSAKPGVNSVAVQKFATGGG
jgi:hypothetical protein